MKKSTIAVIVTLAVLGIAVAVLLSLNFEAIQGRQQLREAGEFLLIHEGAEHVVTVEDIEALGPADFDANYNRSGRPAEVRVFYGVPFSAVLEQLGIDTTGSATVVFSASDGYASVLPIAEALGEAYIALCDERGPFRMVLPRAPFSQQWVHWLTGVELR